MDNQKKWNSRAKKFGSDINGVLFQNLPPYANDEINCWHEKVIVNHFLPKIKSEGIVLDIGCGYGRFVDLIKKERPDVILIGIDFVLEYCKIYSSKGSFSVVASIDALPFVQSSFDGVLCVTSLMYANNALESIAEIKKLMKPEAVGLFVDPGREVIGLLNRLGKKKSETGGDGFFADRYTKIIEENNFIITRKGGLYFSMVPLGLSAYLNNFEWILKLLMKLCIAIDYGRIGYRKYSLHRWIVAKNGSK